MAVIAPFRGVRYNQDLVKRMEDVISPPWDVISQEEQERYYDRNPYNVVRLILGRVFPTDDETHNRYTRAADLFENWQKEGVLLQDDQPSLYIYEIEYASTGETKKRCGIVGLIRLEELGSGQIHPHEMMYSSAKLDRLTLVDKCHANFSPIFSLYSDPEDQIVGLLRPKMRSKPLMEFQDYFRVRHRLWDVREKRVINQVVLAVREKSLLIADGHHRYQATWDFRNKIHATYPHDVETGSFNYVMMYLCNMYSPGLTILPAHRLVSSSVDFDLHHFLSEAKEYFRIESYRHDKAGNKEKLVRYFSGNLGKVNHSLGMYVGGNSDCYILRLKEDLMQTTRGIKPDFRELDVEIFTHFVLERILGLTPEDRDDESLIGYTPDMGGAIRSVDRGDFKVAFILNPTKIQHIQNITSKGLLMPHKSTYFYPKVMTGLVMHKMDL